MVFDSPKSQKSSVSQQIENNLINQRLSNGVLAEDQNEDMSYYEDKSNGGDSMEKKAHSISNSYSNSYDIYNYTNVFFTTERIDLPREKVVHPNSIHSSPSHGFRQRDSHDREKPINEDYKDNFEEEDP